MLDGNGPAPVEKRGTSSDLDLLEEFADHVVSFIDPAAIRPLRVVADTANGMGGLIVPKVFERLPQIELEVMYGELDGTFPNHPADPIQPANQRDLQARVVSGGFDVGLAFDGDAGHAVRGRRGGAAASPARRRPHSWAVNVLSRQPGAMILHNLILFEGGTRGHPRARRRAGSEPRSALVHQIDDGGDGCRVRGEHSAHYYFLDNYRADSGIIATMLVLAEMSKSDQPLSVLRKPFERYSASGEINTQVTDTHAVIEQVASARSPTTTRTASTDSPWIAATGGSTCARRTPSRCCGSTSKLPIAMRASSASGRSSPS